MAKNNRPEIDNPLANIGLDEIVRGITAPDKVKEPGTGASEVQDIQKEGKRRRKGRKALEENLAKYTGVAAQGGQEKAGTYSGECKPKYPVTVSCCGHHNDLH